LKEEKEMYTLYFNRSEKIIKVSKATKALQNLSFTEEVTQYNYCFFICSNRKPLVEKAREIKREWILELEDELNTIEAINI
jgi:hypothetical protein